MLSSGSNPALSSYERDLNREIFSVYLTVNMEDNFKKRVFVLIRIICYESSSSPDVKTSKMLRC